MRLLLLFFLLGTEVSQDMPPDISHVQRYGCDIRQYTEPSKNDVWRVYSWAEYVDKRDRWERVYSIDDSRKKAFKHCDKYMKELVKEIKRFKK